MNQTGVAQSQYIVSQNNAPRSSVKMQASIAISGNGPFEGNPDYMDQLGEMQEKASEKLAETVESIKSKRHGKSLWRIFLTFAVFLFLIESFLSRPISRKPAS